MENNQTRNADNTTYSKKPPELLDAAYLGEFEDEQAYEEYVEWKASKERIYFIDRDYKIIWAKKDETSHEKIAKRILEKNPKLNKLFQKSGEKSPEVFLIMYGYIQCKLNKKNREVQLNYSGISNTEEFIKNIVNGHKNIIYTVKSTDLAKERMNAKDYEQAKLSYLHKGIDLSVCEIIGCLDANKSEGMEI